MGGFFMDGKVGHDATLRTLAPEFCDREYGRAEGRREAEGCPDPAGAAAREGELMRRSCCPGA